MLKLPYQKTKCLDFTDEIEVYLFKIFKSLSKDYGATYMSYTFDLANKIRFAFRTDAKWAHLYHNETLLGKPIIESCPLDIDSREKKNKFIIWDLYTNKAQPKHYREIMGLREDIGLMHGITLSAHFGNHHDALAISTDEQKNDLSTNIFSENNGSDLKNSLIDCRKYILNLLLRHHYGNHESKK